MIEKILHRVNMRKACKAVVKNKGSAGIDGMNVKELQNFVDSNIGQVATAIYNNQYLPKAIKGVEIPKNNGKTRLLGVPTVVDRWLQQSVSQAIMPIFEAEFKPNSFGFRPNKNAQQAVLKAQEYINQGYKNIVDIDLKNFFDEVDHAILLQLLYNKIKCKTTLRLIRKWLRVPILINGKLTKRRKGVPQGSPLSPLLSNILLHELDKEMERNGYTYIRYADDFSIYFKSKEAARKAGNKIYLFLKNKLKLPINREKSGIRKPVHFEILGYRFVPTYIKGEKGQYQLTVSEKSWKELKQKLKLITKKTAPKSISERISEIKTVQRGWVNYFRLASIHQKLRDVDSWIRNRLRYCIWHDWKKPERKRKNFIRLGLDQETAYKWSRTRMGGWAVAQSPILKTTITLVRLHKRGYISLLDYYLKLCPERDKRQPLLFNEPPYTRPVRTVV